MIFVLKTETPDVFIDLLQKGICTKRLRERVINVLHQKAISHRLVYAARLIALVLGKSFIFFTKKKKT